MLIHVIIMKRIKYITKLLEKSLAANMRKDFDVLGQIRSVWVLARNLYESPLDLRTSTLKECLQFNCIQCKISLRIFITAHIVKCAIHNINYYIVRSI